MAYNKMKPVIDLGHLFYSFMQEKEERRRKSRNKGGKVTLL